MDELVDEALSPGHVPPPAFGTARVASGGRPAPAWAAFLAGAVAGVVGLTPWLIGGARLPVQNLWDGGIPAEAPVVLLPFSQYTVTSIFALLVVAGAVAGVAARALVSRGGGRGRALWVGGGLLVVQVFAAVQTVAVVGKGLRGGPDSAVYLAGIGGGVAACLLVSAGVFVLVALAPRAGALLGLSIGAIAAGLWLPIAFADPVSSMSAPMWLLRAFTYVMPILVGSAIVWAGVRTVGRVASALVSLVLVWLAPPLATAVWNALGSRVLARDLEGMLEYGQGIFRQYATDVALVRTPVAVAVAVAVVGLVGREVLGRRSQLTEQIG
jgi:hypothetical protein